jgi:hypothetical protein
VVLAPDAASEPPPLQPAQLGESEQHVYP